MTIRVKIGVAVDGSGNWSCIGYSKMDDDEIYVAGDALDADANYFWVEADLPEVEIKTLKAKEVVSAPPPE